MVTVPGLGEVDGRTPLDALECVCCILLPSKHLPPASSSLFHFNCAEAWPRLSVNHCGAEGSSNIRSILSENDLDRVVAFARWLAVAANFLGPVYNLFQNMAALRPVLGSGQRYKATAIVEPVGAVPWPSLMVCCSLL